MQTLLPVALLATALVAVAAFAFRRLLAPAATPGDLNHLRPFSANFYQPMERLLSERDIEFLRSQAGYDAAMERRLRRQRRAAFRAYLRHLQSDFTRLHRAARFLVTHGATDRPDLAAQLIRQSLRFWTLMVWTVICFEITHVQPARTIRGLVEVPRWMQEQIGAITAPAAA